MNITEANKLLELFANLCVRLHQIDSDRPDPIINGIGGNIDKILDLTGPTTWQDTAAALRKKIRSLDLRWEGHVLFLNGNEIGRIHCDRDYWYTTMSDSRRGQSSDRDTAAALAVLLAGDDPGGQWSIYDCPVTPVVIQNTYHLGTVQWKPKT
jgi:hypothetical protein